MSWHEFFSTIKRDPCKTHNFDRGVVRMIFLEYSHDINYFLFFYFFKTNKFPLEIHQVTTSLVNDSF